MLQNKIVLENLLKEILAEETQLFKCKANKGFLKRLVSIFMPKLRNNPVLGKLVKDWENKLNKDKELRKEAYKELSSSFNQIKAQLEVLAKNGVTVSSSTGNETERCCELMLIKKIIILDCMSTNRFIGSNNVSALEVKALYENAGIKLARMMLECKEKLDKHRKPCQQITVQHNHVYNEGLAIMNTQLNRNGAC